VSDSVLLLQGWLHSRRLDGKERSVPGRDVEPVSGIEPLTCRLQLLRLTAPRALPALTAQGITQNALNAPADAVPSFHEPLHARAESAGTSVTLRITVRVIEKIAWHVHRGEVTTHGTVPGERIMSAMGAPAAEATSPLMPVVRAPSAAPQIGVVFSGQPCRMCLSPFVG
jgi:hypothetical protein